MVVFLKEKASRSLIKMSLHVGFTLSLVLVARGKNGVIKLVY